MTTTSSSTSPRGRRGFTLVELLVAMALIIFIMVILTESFTAGVGTFRALKAQGDMQEKLRSTSILLRDDLLHLHFDGNQRLSTIVPLTNPPSPNAIGGGYFFIQQPGSFPEGQDGYGILSLRMNPAATTALAFTVRRNGILPQDYFVGRIPGQADYPALPAYSAGESLLFAQGPVDYQSPRSLTNPQQSGTLISQWAEIGYFLVPTGKTAGTANPAPLYSLRRRQRVVLTDQPTATALNTVTRVPTNLGVLSPNNPNLYAARYAEVSTLPDPANPGFLYFNTPSDLTKPTNQVMPQTLTPLALNGQGQADWFGDDIVLTDVISFNVRVLYPGVGDFDQSLVPVTYNTATVPQRVSALEITIRVWDVKTSLTRQITIVQDM